jgi:hypothetical protein
MVVRRRLQARGEDYGSRGHTQCMRSREEVGRHAIDGFVAPSLGCCNDNGRLAPARNATGNNTRARRPK